MAPEQTLRKPETNLSDALEAYHQTLGSLAEGHAQNSATIAEQYSAGIDAWNGALPESQTETGFRIIVDRASEDIQQESADVAEQVSLAIGGERATFEALIPPADQGVYEQSVQLAQELGIQNVKTRQAIGAASTPESQAAIRAALDSVVLRNALHIARKNGVHDMSTLKEVSYASSPQAAVAIHAALDSTALRNARHFAEKHGPEDMTTIREARAASTPHAEAAIRAALDKAVLSKAQRFAIEHGQDNMSTIQITRAASTPRAQALVKQLLAKPAAPKSHQSSGGEKARRKPTAEETAAFARLFAAATDGLFGRAGFVRPRRPAEPDPYQVLGLSKDASKEDIKTTFRKAAQAEHPDKQGNEEKFKALAGAHDILGTPTRRAYYDQHHTMEGYKGP